MLAALKLEIDLQMGAFRIAASDLREALSDPLVADLYARGLRVYSKTQEYTKGIDGGPNRRTGRLAGSIGIRIGYDALSPYVDVGTALYYAPYVEFGHRNTPHAYPAYTPGGTYTGVGWVGSKPTRPFPFLSPAAAAARTT